MIGQIDYTRVIKEDSEDSLKNNITFGDTVLLIQYKHICKCFFIGTSTTGNTRYFIINDTGTVYSDHAKYITIKHEWLGEDDVVPNILREYSEFLDYCCNTKPAKKVIKFEDYIKTKGI